MSSHTAIGPWLRTTRLRRRTTEAALAKHLGTEQSMLAMVERGEKDPGPELEGKIRDWIKSGPALESARGAYQK